MGMARPSGHLVGSSIEALPCPTMRPHTFWFPCVLGFTITVIYAFPTVRRVQPPSFLALLPLSVEPHVAACLMAASIDQRRILVTVRAASDLPNVAFAGKNTPYMEITIDDTTVTTKPNEMDPVNPVWDETFEFKVPGAAPEEEPLMLRVTVKNETTLLPDSTIGKGAVPLGQLWATGSEEARIPLTDNSGTAAGVAFVGIKVCTPEDQAEIRKKYHVGCCQYLIEEKFSHELAHCPFP